MLRVDTRMNMKKRNKQDVPQKHSRAIYMMPESATYRTERRVLSADLSHAVLL